MQFDVNNKSSEILVFHTHQGFGDLIVCSPIAHYLSYLFPNKKIFFITRDTHKKNIKRFISSNDKIEAVSIPGYPSHSENSVSKEISIVYEWVIENKFSLIRTGFEKYAHDPDDFWDKSFYEKIGIDYKIKYEFNLFDRNFKNEDLIYKKILQSSLSNINESFAFVHDDPDRGFFINPQTKLKIIKNDKSVDIIDMLGIMESASEIHMMGSSLLCLAEMAGLPKENQLAFYYSFRNNLYFNNKEKWKII